MKVILEEIKTTGDLADALSKLPRNTKISPFGSTICRLIYDENNKRAYIDEDFSWSDEDDFK